MPLHLASRRQFITRLGAIVALTHAESPAAEVDGDWIAILNDTHIGARHPETASIPANLRTTVSWLLSQPKRPAAVIINGDLALRDGKAGDYGHFARLITPLREAGVPLHLTMGNHDDRAVFYDVLKSEKPRAPVVEARHVGIVPLPRANLFLLDSLKQTMISQGVLGGTQRQWLAKELDARADKPALVFAHHNPRLGGNPRDFPGGLEDSEELWRILAARKHVKAYVHGHIHHRSFAAHEGIHILNTPATSYVADKKTSTTGWTMLRIADDGVEVTTHTHQPDHAWNGTREALKWRV